MEEIVKGVLVCIPFLLLFLIVPNWIGGSPDYGIHFTMAIERYHGEQLTSPDYAPLLPSLLGIFSVKERYFEFATMFMILIITPILIVLITKSYLGAFFYLTTSSYFYFMTAGLFAQAALGIFLLGLFATKNIYVRLGLVVLGSLSHSFGPIAMIATLFVILVNEQFFPPAFFLSGFCSPIWGSKLPTALATNVSAINYGGSEVMTVNDIGSLFFKISPFPFLFMGFKYFFEHREFHYLFLFFVSLVGAYFVNVRMLYFAGLISVIGFTKAFSGLQHKKAWLVLAGLNGLLLLVQHELLVSQFFCS